MSKEFNEELVGPRSDERIRKFEDVNKEGQQIYLAFMSDSPVVDKNEVERAKNAYTNFAEKNPNVIEMCKRSTLEECRELIKDAA